MENEGLSTLASTVTILSKSGFNFLLLTKGAGIAQSL
jgi:hypothetical protein